MSIHIKGEKKKKGNWFLLIVSCFILVFSLSFFFYTKYSSRIQDEGYLEKNQGIVPQEAIVINFSHPVIPNSWGWKLEFSPPMEADFQWENYNKKLIITPKKNWLIENEYQISVSGRNIFLYPLDKNYYFRTIDYPKMIDFRPVYGEKDVVLDIEDPITASFDSSLKDFKVKFVINPFKELDYSVDYENDKVSLMPKGELEKGKRYNISIYLRYKDEGEDEYKKINETFFETKPTPQQAWNSDLTARLEQARQFTEAKITEGKYIDINVKSQVMAIFENGELLDVYLVSSGKRGMETPQGSFQVSNKTPRAWSNKYGLYMPYWMAIVKSGDFGIHELPEWPGGYKEGVNHLGIPVSHGCVRLGVGPAERVYKWAEVGTPIFIHS